MKADFMNFAKLKHGAPNLLLLAATIITMTSVWFFTHQARALNRNECNMTNVSLGTVGYEVACKEVVDVKAVYSVFLEYYYPGEDKEIGDKQVREDMREALGTPVFKGQPGSKHWTEQTYPVTVRIQVSNSDTGQVHADDVVRPKADIKGKHSVMSELVKGKLSPGTYNITLKITDTRSGLNSIKTNLKFSKSYTGN